MTLQEIDNLCAYIYENIEMLKDIKRELTESEYKNINTRKLWRQTTETREVIMKILDYLNI